MWTNGSEKEYSQDWVLLGRQEASRELRLQVGLGAQETDKFACFSKLSFGFQELGGEDSLFLPANFSSPPGTKGPSLKVTIMKAMQEC